MYVLVLLLFHGLTSAEAGNVACSAPDDITNGRKTYTGLNQNDVVTYTCIHGYRLSAGTLTRTCQSDSSWDGTLPTCTDIDSYFSFECYVNSTIYAVNPDPTSLIWAEASNVNGTCTTSFNSDKSLVTIEGCALDNVILLVFSPYNTGIPTVITDSVKYYNVTCMTIPPDGILVNLVDKTWIRNVMSTTREPPRTPKVYINSDIGAVDSVMENVTTIPDPDTSLAINELLRWKLYVPEQYIIQPINCTAYSGTIDELGSKFSLDVIQFGCSLDLDIVSDFTFPDTGQTHTMVADINVFRFPGSDVIEIVCSVRGCPQGSTECDFTCPTRTKRSATNQPTHIDFSEATSGSDDGGRYARAAKDTLHKTASISFRVVGPPTVGLQYLYIFESSSQRTASWAVILVFSVIVVRLLRI